MTFGQIIRAAIPGADEDTVDHVLWGRTPYPVGRITAKSLFKAASGFRRAAANGIHLCDHCHSMALPDRFECGPCGVALRRPHA